MQSSEFRLQNEDAEDRELKRTRSAEVPQGGTAKFLLMLCRVYTVLPLFVLSSRSPERAFLRGSRNPFWRTPAFAQIYGLYFKNSPCQLRCAIPAYLATTSGMMTSAVWLEVVHLLR